MVLSTARLDLHPLPLPVLEALLAGDLERADALVPFRIRADSFADDEYVLRLRADQLGADPTELPWLYRAVVLRATGEVVARAAMLGWAGAQGAARCLGSTSPDNLASQGVLTRLGFVRTGEQVDEVDGLEWVFTRELLPGGGGLR